MRPLASILLLAPALAGCATVAEGGGGDENLPNAAAGPFRELRQPELGNLRSAPNALENDEIYPRDPAVVDVDGDLATLEVVAFVASTLVPDGEDPAPPETPPNAIVRHGALDGRSFDREAAVVLEPMGAEEGGTVGAPAVVRGDGELLLYYEHAAGIGVASSSDGGQTFARVSGAGLGASARGWDGGALPRRPAVVRLPGGEFRMFYDADPNGDGRTSIGEASSSDGRSWQREQEPVLSPSDSAQAPADEPTWDGMAVDSPFAIIAVDALGEPVLRLFHGAVSESGVRVVALAARRAEDPLARAVSPVFGAQSDLGPHEPCVVAFEGFALLYTTQRAGPGVGEAHPAIAVGVAPADVTLPAPNPP